MNKVKLSLFTATIVLAMAFTQSFAQEKGSFTDARDKKTYKTVKIGKQVWMAENLNYNAKDSKCYDNKEANCKKYGRLYKSENSKSVCPAGWHLPTKKEWRELYVAAGGWETAEKFLKSKSGWTDDREDFGSSKKISGNGEDKFGFAALPGGTYGYFSESGDPPSFGLVGTCGIFFISDEYEHYHKIWNVGAGVSAMMMKDLSPSLFSARCIQDDAEWVKVMAEADAKEAEAEAKEKEKARVEAEAKAKEELNIKNNSGTFIDARDKKTYKTVKIGNQTWMAENLNYDAKGSKCYDNKPENCKKYGRLYNWETAMKSCPVGWHLPSADEWDVLDNFVDYMKTKSKHLKARKGWNGNGNGLDTYGFAALPGGYVSGGPFSSVGDDGNWWSSTDYDGRGDAYSRGMGYLNEVVGWDYFVKSLLFSVRCLQDICDGQPYMSETHFCYIDKTIYAKCLDRAYDPKTKVCNGEWKTFYESGKLESVGNYKDGEQNGKWEWYYESGKLKSVGNYKDGKAHGESRGFYEDGKLQSVGNYKNWILDGKQETYGEDGKLKAVVIYKNGAIEDGKVEKYDNNKKLQSVEIYKKGKIEKRESYFENGKLRGVENYDGKMYKSEGYYENGKLESVYNSKDKKRDGKQERYYENGKLQSVENYKDDKQEGSQEWYHENGKLAGVRNYKNGRESGKPNGKWEIYDQDGNLQSVENWKNGINEGEKKYSYENGKLKSVQSYKNGKIDKSEMYNAEEKLQSVQNYKNEKMDKQEMYHANGKIQFVTNYKDGKMDKSEGYYENGKIQSVTNYKDGKMNKQEMYHPNGKIQAVYNYKNGLPEGKVETYYESGKLYFEWNYKNGKMDGERKQYLENGKLISVHKYKDGKMEDGKVEFYHANGKLQSVQNYKDGKVEDGKVEYYRPDGNLSGIVIYKGGNIEEGKVENYHANGKLQSVQNYKDGKLEGKWEMYNAEGKPVLMYNYKEGKPDGKWETYDTDGKVQTTIYYKNGIQQ
jgi:uncharacterized protein (TIGR02145 family)